MSITNNLFTGTSGISAHGDAIGVVGDNIANVSTTGFKSSRAGFADVLGGIASNGQRVGVGVRMDGAHTRFGQGALQQTGGPLDMGINGNGFFVLNGTHSGTPGQFYSRDGRFSLDNDGFVVNPGGLRLQGFPIAADGTQGATLGDLQIGAGQAPPLATSNISMTLNLDGNAATPAAAFDPADPEGTSNFSTSMTVFDSLGAERRVDLGGGHPLQGLVRLVRVPLPDLIAPGFRAVRDQKGVSHGFTEPRGYRFPRRRRKGSNMTLAVTGSRRSGRRADSTPF